MQTKTVEIGDQMRGRVVDEIGDGRRSSRASLVVEHDAPKRGIVETSMMRQAATSWSAVNENQRYAIVLPADFPMHQVAAVEGQRSSRHRIAWRIQQGVGGVRMSGVSQVLASLKK